MILFIQDLVQEFPKHAPDPRGLLGDACKHDGAADSEGQRLLPLLLEVVASRHNSSQGARGDPQADVLPAALVLEQDGPAAEGAARADADAAVEGLGGLVGRAQDAWAEARAAQAHAVVEDGGEGADEGGGARGGLHGVDEALARRVAQHEGDVERDVGREAEDGGLREARYQVPLAVMPAAHVHHRAGEGGALDRIGVVKGPVEVLAHTLQKNRFALGSLGAVLDGT